MIGIYRYIESYKNIEKIGIENEIYNLSPSNDWSVPDDVVYTYIYSI